VTIDSRVGAGGSVIQVGFSRSVLDPPISSTTQPRDAGVTKFLELWYVSGAGLWLAVYEGPITRRAVLELRSVAPAMVELEDPASP